jgi:hypothetical protein
MMTLRVEILFPDLKIRVRPEPGMLVCFPSNHHYKHGVEPVTKGKDIVLFVGQGERISNTGRTKQRTISKIWYTHK